MPHTIRPMLPSDLDAVLRIQAACYPPPMQEPAAIVLARRAAAPATCVVCCAGGCERGNAPGVCGYLFAYPSRLGAVTALGAPFAPAPDADTLYLHDLSIDPRALGRGLARALVTHLLAGGRAAGIAQAALVSVQDSAGFWQALGFREAVSTDPALATYPAGARYMVRPAP